MFVGPRYLLWTIECNSVASTEMKANLFGKGRIASFLTMLMVAADLIQVVTQILRAGAL